MWLERRKLVQTWRDGRAAALATLVTVEGSSYRKPGARLMVTMDGASVGSISGGCLESDVIRKIRWLVREGASVQRYSTAFDDTAELPFGSGCGGTVEILMEPADTPAFQELMEAMAGSLQGRSYTAHTVLPAVGRALLRTIRPSGGAPAAAAVTDAGVYVEQLGPPHRLLVFGAGDDAQPLVTMADLLGWSVIVLDGRAQWARRERFPQAAAVWCVEPGALLPFTPQPHDLAVVMTHSFEQDRSWLQHLLPLRLQYVGLLGARHRSALLADMLAEQLGWSLESVCEQLHAPVGLDLGGDGAEAVALATLAEMQATVAGRPILPRRLTGTHAAELRPHAESLHLSDLHCSL